MSTHARNQFRQPKGVPVGGQWKAMARLEGAVVLGEPTSYEWAAAGVDPFGARAWQDAVFLPEEAAEWQDRSFAPEEADRWRHALFGSAEAVLWRDAGFGPEEASGWEKASFALPEAASWRDASFEPEEARGWEEARFAPAEAAPWRDAAFEPEEASEWAQAGGRLLGVGDIGPVPRMALVAVGDETVWVRHVEGGSQCFDGDRRLHSVADMASVRSEHGYRAWHRYGAPHREVGPARSWPDGRRQYWERGQRLASYTPPGWEAPPAGRGWKQVGPIWVHAACPCGTGKAVPVELVDRPLGAEATCPTCGDQVVVPG